MKQPQMFPKPPKRMIQPRKDVFRLRAELAEARLAYVTTPIWWRWWHRISSRLARGQEEMNAGAWLLLVLYCFPVLCGLTHDPNYHPWAPDPAQEPEENE